MMKQERPTYLLNRIMRKPHQTPAESQVQSYLSLLLNACDVFTIILPYCDIKTLCAFHWAFTIENIAPQKMSTLAQEKIPVAYSMITQQIIFSPQKSLRDQTIQTRFLLREKKLTCEFVDDRDVWIALSSGQLDFYGKLKILIENANRFFEHIPQELENNIIDFFVRIIQNHYSYTGVNIENNQRHTLRHFSHDEEHIQYLNNENAHLIGSNGVFDIDRIPSLLLTYTPDSKILNACWNKLLKTKDRGDSQVRWKAICCLTEFSLLLNDEAKMNVCKRLITEMVNSYISSEEAYYKDFASEWRIRAVDLLTKLIVRTESPTKISTIWGDLTEMLLDSRAHIRMYAICFLTELALRDKNKIEPCLDLINKIERENPRINPQIWLEFTRLVVALQDNNTIKMYRDLAFTTWRDASYCDTGPRHVVLLECATELTLALNNQNESVYLYQAIKNKMSEEEFCKISICFMQLAININTPEILQECWDLIITRIEQENEPVSKVAYMCNTQILHYLAELTIALKNTGKMHQCWTLLSLKMAPALTNYYEASSPQLVAMKSLTQLALELKNPDVLMECWDLMIKRKIPHGMVCFNVQPIDYLIQLAFELKDKQKMMMLLSDFNDPSQIRLFFGGPDLIQRTLLDAYATVGADPTCRIDFSTSVDIMQQAGALIERLNQYVVPYLNCLNASNSEEEKHLERILNESFYKRFYEPATWNESQPTFNQEEFIEAFNAFVTSLHEKHDTDSLMKHLTMPEAIKIRFLLHEAYGQTIFPKESIADSETFRRALCVYIENLHQQHLKSKFSM